MTGGIPVQVVISGALVSGNMESVVQAGKLYTLGTDAGSTTPPPPPTSPTPGLGLYAGGGSSEYTTGTTNFQAVPNLAASYYQTNQATLSPSIEKTRMDQGIDPVITWTCKDNTSYYTDIANQSGAGWTQCQNYVNALASLSTYATSKGRTLYATFDHEFTVKVAQGTITGVSFATFSDAWTNWHALMRSNAPNVKTLYWEGGASLRRTDIQTIASAINGLPDMVTMDPYSGTSHSATETFTQMANGYLTWIRGSSWYAHLGSPPIGFTEFGCKRLGTISVQDTNMAAFYTNLRSQMAALNVKWAIFFDRSPDNNVVAVTPDTYPLATAALAASYAQTL